MAIETLISELQMYASKGYTHVRVITDFTFRTDNDDPDVGDVIDFSTTEDEADVVFLDVI
jgi:hypothetical protein